MLQVTSEQWLSWLSLYFWPLLRVLALISTAPIVSERSVPKRVKLGLAMMITFAIASRCRDLKLCRCAFCSRPT
uniref:flagellar biosynthetic protein FliR n=1 Tax=Escherichia coli TaxID=562 RepID=UPI0035A7291E